ncbi:MAG: hypothetical protein Q7T55_06825 [Solirubrobacteraceae bacterium]|nr:hypothetical protein [Solirubrobacteraceae bacterium]
MRRLVPRAATLTLARTLIALAVFLAIVALPSSAFAQAGTTPEPAAPPSVEASGLDVTPDPWRLADDIGARIENLWRPNRGVYINERGSPDTRLNSLMLQLHGMAALAGHNGAIRHDERIPAIVGVLTSAPVLVSNSLRPREIGHIPHAPAWTPLIGEDPEHAGLHPSVDTAAVRGLLAAWRARAVIGMDQATVDRIGQVISETAHSAYYGGGSRALNQINWAVEVYAAALEITGDTSVLASYREQLVWFAEHAHTKTEKAGSSNLTSGGGLHYLPNRPLSSSLNKIETIEYGNLALSSLGMYQAAIRAGMPPLPAQDVATLQAWSRHMLLGSWTHAGYPNWDTGLGTKRRHLRQYWAWSLDSLMTASGRDALLGYPKQRAYARSIAQHGIALYLATAWNPAMVSPDVPLPPKTSFDAPNGFSEGSGNVLISPLRFAVLSASLDGRFQDIGPDLPPNWMAHDRETGRLAFSTPVYNGAIVPSRGGQAQGGIEPVRLFDSEMNPLTALGGRGTGSLGLALVQDGITRLDTEPAAPTRQSTRDLRLSGKPADTAASFGTAMEATAGASSKVGKVDLRHRLTTDGIDTTYRLVKIAKGTRVELRVPVWGKDGNVSFDGGAIRKGGRWVRTTTPLRVTGTTATGGDFTVAFGGIPSSSRLAITEVRPSSWLPNGARQLLVSFSVRKDSSTKITRSIVVKRYR